MDYEEELNDTSDNSSNEVDAPSTNENLDTNHDNVNEASGSGNSVNGNGYNSQLARNNREAYQKGLNKSYDNRINDSKNRLAQSKEKAAASRARAQNTEGKNFVQKAKDKVSSVKDNLDVAKNKRNLKIDEKNAKKADRFKRWHPIEAAKMAAKEAIKAKIKAWILVALASSWPFLLGIFVIFIAVLMISGLTDGGSVSGGTIYDSECNYEETTITVMNAQLTETFHVISLKDYIIGVLCGEEGVCDGNVEDLDEDYIKTQIVAYKTYTLGRRSQYNNTTKSIIMKASTRDQQYCNIEKGCIYTDEVNTIYYNTYDADYDQTKFKDEVLYSNGRSFTDKDLELLEKYYAETYGELFLPDSFDGVITKLTTKESTSYASKIQKFWEQEAAKGRSYEEILKSTGATGLPYSEYYVDRDIYRLRNYCAATNYGSSGLEYAQGEMTYLSGGLQIPIYYQGDYNDVILAQRNGEIRSVADYGCGFTSSAMIVSYLLDKKITPREFVDDWSRKYYVWGDGMSHSLPNAAAEYYGLGAVKTTTNDDEMIQALKDGHPVMSSQSPGLFTKSGHLIVLRGITQDGKILVNDPNRKNAVTKGYNSREFTLNEISNTNKKYFIWPKK